MPSTSTPPARSRKHTSPPRRLRMMLVGGDRRSIAQASRARDAVIRAPARLAELVDLVGDPDWLVSLRALDVLEKLARRNPLMLHAHRRVFIGSIADAEPWEIRLQVVRALPLLSWSPRERHRVLEILRANVTHPQLFVRAWALDGLASFAADDPNLRAEVGRHLDAFDRSGRKALTARAARIRSRLRLA